MEMRIGSKNFESLSPISIVLLAPLALYRRLLIKHKGGIEKICPRQTGGRARNGSNGC